jgi:transposase
MMFGQLSNRESLSDLVLTINAHPGKLYHLGFGKGVSKTNLARANEQRESLIYQEFAYHLIGEARKVCLPEYETSFSFAQSVYAFDSTIIDLCLTVFCWATFRKTRAGVKLHTLYDIRTSIPVFIHVSAASVNDMNAMDEIVYEPGSFYVFDRGYHDYERLYIIHRSKSYFVLRAKHNMQFERAYSLAIDKSKGIRYDQIGYLKGFYSFKGFPEKIRRVKFHDKEQNRTLVFMTNHLDLKAEEIAALYKHRWKIELFFKWIKQHLRITSFWGRTQNAVKTQVYTAVITYTIVAIIKRKLKSDYTAYEILQILGTSLLDKTPINQLLQKENNQDVKELLYNQLKIF